MLVRSPTLTKRLSALIVNGSRPERRMAGATSTGTRGVLSATASAMARMWAGVVPQHPPTRLTRPLSANSDTIAAVSSAASSYSPKALGRPALGYADTKMSAMRDSSATYGRISRAPRAQLSPTSNGRAWRTEFQKASVVCPDRVRPDASVMVPLMTTGQRRPRSVKTWSTAEMAALALRVSKIVSMMTRSAPPSSRPRVASEYAATSSS